MTIAGRNRDISTEGFPFLGEQYIPCFRCSTSEYPLDAPLMIPISPFHEKLSSDVTEVSNWMGRVESHYSLDARTFMLALDHFDTVLTLLYHKKAGARTSNDVVYNIASKNKMKLRKQIM